MLDMLACQQAQIASTHNDSVTPKSTDGPAHVRTDKKAIITSAEAQIECAQANLALGDARADWLTTLPDDLLSQHVLCKLAACDLRTAVSASKTLRALGTSAALAAAELMVPGIGPIVLRVDMDARERMWSQGASPSSPLETVLPKSRVRLRTATASAWLFHLENQERWVKWLSAHLIVGERAPLVTLPFLVPWGHTSPEVACAEVAKAQPPMSIDVGCERALLNLCDAPMATIALHAVPMAVSILAQAHVQAHVAGTLACRTESPSVLRGCVRLIGRLKPSVLHTHTPLLFRFLEDDQERPLRMRVSAWEQLERERTRLRQLVLSTVRKCASFLKSDQIETVVHLAVNCSDSSSSNEANEDTNESLRQADELLMRTTAVEVLQGVQPSAIDVYIPQLLPLLDESPSRRKQSRLDAAVDALLRGHDLSLYGCIADTAWVTLRDSTPNTSGRMARPHRLQLRA